VWHLSSGDEGTTPTAASFCEVGRFWGAREAQLRHKSDCKKGDHSFDQSSSVGGGIRRRVCSGCGIVEIQLESEPELESTRLFRPTRVDSLFAIQTALELTFEFREQRFGVRSHRRPMSSEVA